MEYMNQLNPKELKNLPLLGRGATAEVYLYSQDKILKLFLEHYRLEAVQYEWDLAQKVQERNAYVPRCFDILQVEGRFGIVYQYIPGKLLFEAIIKNPWSSFGIIRKMARLQAEINQILHPDLPAQEDRLTYLMKGQVQLEPYRETLMRGLAGLSRGNAICHGDFHVGNIIQWEDQYYVIDWMNAYRGDPHGDLIRSYLMLVSPYIPLELGPLKTLGFRILKWTLGRIFLGTYRKYLPLNRRVIRQWLPIIAAARMADGVPNEEAWLLKLIKKNLPHLKRAL